MIRRLAPLCLIPLLACANASVEEEQGDPSAVSSNDARFVDFSFTAELEADREIDVKRAATSQLLYIVGHLRDRDSNAQIHATTIEGATWSRLDSGKHKLVYTAKVPVGWSKRSGNPPATFDLVLPRRIGDLDAFYDAYGSACSGGEASSDSLWVYFDPRKSGCSPKDEDVVKARATVTPARNTTQGKLPEYDKIWQDGLFKLVIVYGKDGAFSSSTSDLGVADRNRFLRTLRRDYAGARTKPETLADDPATDVTEITVYGGEGDRRWEVVTLLVDGMGYVDSEWDARYETLSRDADIVEYAGHSGYGKNILAFADRGAMVKGKYQIVFLDGCNTYAYLDDRLNRRRAAANPDDPAGTKYMDLIVNVTPAPFGTNSNVVLVAAMLEGKKSYNQIFEGFPSSQHATVTGEEDNQYRPR